jgi:hypothetical protein
MFTGIEKEGISGFGVGSKWLCAVEYFGGRMGLCGPARCRVRRPPPILVMFLLREFGLEKAFFEAVCRISGGVIFFAFRVFESRLS